MRTSRRAQNPHLMVAPFILRRMKQDVLDDLPEKIETVMTSEMTPGQAKVYHAYAEKLMQEAESELADPQGRMKLLAGLTRLRQLCCDPRLCLEEYAAGSGKLGQLIELAGGLAAQGRRMLIFSQFTSMLALLEEALHDAGLQTLKLTGETDKIERMALVEQFNSGDIPVFLISLKAGGTGLNLTGADVVIHYDPWWNTAARNQATDRALPDRADEGRAGVRSDCRRIPSRNASCCFSRKRKRSATACFWERTRCSLWTRLRFGRS
ncbi:MAG: DEAD/DEAH box helicase [Oscillospiraceae bacterium]